MNNDVKDNIKHVYKKYAGEFDEKIASLEIYNESYDYLLNRIQENASVLDLACGPGNVSLYLKRRLPGLKITGVDISEEMIEIAETRIHDGRFMVKDICEVGFNTQFDCVICAFGIPYLDKKETDHLVTTIKESLNDHGYFYISFIEGSKRGYAKQSFTGNDELFIYYHTEDFIIELLDRHALSVKKKFGIDYHEKDGSITNEIIYIGNSFS